MANYNLTMNLGYKGSGLANGIPAYVDNGAYLIGGAQSGSDTATATFGVVMSHDPAATDDGQFFCGKPTGYAVAGVLIYHAGIAMNDPAKPDSFIKGQPLTLMYEGPLWLHTWTKLAVGSIDPEIGAVVVFNNTTGAIEFMPRGSSAQTGYTVLAAEVRSVSDDTSGAMLFVHT
jgi:hypothetical protein